MYGNKFPPRDLQVASSRLKSEHDDDDDDWFISIAMSLVTVTDGVTNDS